MRTKQIITAMLSILLVFSLAACGNNNQAAPKETNGGAAADAPKDTAAPAKTVQKVKLVFGAGGTSGTYYPIGGALKTLFEKSDLIDSVTVEATGASVKNIQNIRDGLNQVAIVMSDVAYDAVSGTGNFKDGKVDIMGMAGLYPNVVQLVVTKKSGIHSVADLKGKKVGVGEVGSGVEQSAKKVLAAAGLQYGDLAMVDHTGYADSVQKMKDGNMDAAFFTSGVPNSNITDLQQSMDIELIPIDGEVAANLIKAYPFYEEFTIPKGDNKQYNLPNDVKMVAIKNMLIVSKDLSDDVVYEMTKSFYDYLGTDQVAVGALKDFNRDDMGKNLVAPLHPGAKKFYEEKGLLK
ncbi:TAXI family TRAP transporter solute-binding subunit [Ferviditalea candida]|uniref:TAXI family TRAP transporter solute-binding subunit n=1 Tax=Ferviditalea candida TaxID=3108399 RepID=A0ABU5ZI52_9BACL|nr:TAXI family TRAP transporter solute-binding subunit [Paenibacillaceae bacterium T2]